MSKIKLDDSIHAVLVKSGFLDVPNYIQLQWISRRPYNWIEYWSFGRPALNGKERIEVWKQCLKSNALSSDSHIRGYVKPSVNYSLNPEYLSFHEVKALYDSLSESLDFSMYTKYSSGQEGEVMRDVVRTYQAHPLFNGDGSPGIRVLSRVLLVYIRARPSVGYCQGMNFILGAMFICWVGGGDDGEDDGEGGAPPPSASAVPALAEEELQSVQYSLFEM
eukprot:gene30448-36797_t